MSREYPCVYFKSGGKCDKFSDEESLSFCVMGPCEYETPSNADHIRSLSDEELSEALLCPKNHDRSGILQAYCSVDATCEECILGWLRKPYEGGKDDGQTDV